MSGHPKAHRHGDAAAVGQARQRRLQIAIALNVAIVIGQLAASTLASSVGLAADAVHNLTDVLALGVALVAVRLSLRPATQRRSYGWHRATVLGALANAAAILGTSAFVLIEALRRLGDPEPVRGGIVVVAALAGAIVNTVSAVVVHERSPDINTRGALLHLVSDAATSVAVAGCGAVILLTGGFEWLDPAAALAISLVIAWQGWRLARAATDILLESTPAGLDTDDLAEQVRAVDGVDGVHHLHAWNLSSEVVALSAHVVLSGDPSLAEAQRTGDRVRELLHGLGIDHTTLELEAAPCAAPDPDHR